MNQPVRRLFEFGPFCLDATERLLHKQGKHVPLTPKAFHTLLVLVENAGHLVDKDELIRQVWPDTFVEESSLAKNISHLRKVLGGGQQSDEYIETIPKRGYRFVAPVSEIPGGSVDQTRLKEPGALWDGIDADRVTRANLSDAVPVNETLPAHKLMDRRSARPVWLAAFLVLGLGVVVTGWLILPRGNSSPPEPVLKVIPFTSFPGRETHPAFSPDGNQIAFTWDGGEGSNLDIYVKLIGAGEPLRLTTNPASDSHPAWSPDGRYIAFFRQTPENSTFCLVPALGGPERKLGDVFRYQSPTAGSSDYYSPRGDTLAVADRASSDEPSRIVLMSVETGAKKPVTSPVRGTVGDFYPSFSPDGKTLGFVRSSSLATTDIYLQPLGQSQPRRLTTDNTSILGYSWTSDGRDIVFVSRRGGSVYNLWRIPVEGGAPVPVPSVGRNVSSPRISPKGNRLAYTQGLDDLNIWRVELAPAGTTPARERLIASTLTDNGPDYCAANQKIVFASSRSGGFGIWVCNADGSDPMLLIDRGPHLAGTPRWSSDGRWIAFDSRSSDAGRHGNPDIYVISADGGPPRRLTFDPSEDIVPSWSRDGKHVYFGSMRSGAMQIWKVPFAGGPAVQVTRQGGFEAMESVDGTLLFYAKGRSVPGIWQVPVDGGEEKLVTDEHRAGFWRLWTVVEKGVYFATANAPARPVIEFFDFDTGRVRPVAFLDKPLSRSEPGLTVTSDFRWLLFPQLDETGSDIMLAENFR